MSRGGKFVRKRDKKPLTGKMIFLLILNAVMLVGVLVSSLKLGSVTHALLTQSAAKAWRGSNELRFAQVSAFLPEDGKIALSAVESFRRTLEQALVNASLEAPEGGSLYTDAYSGKAEISVSSNKSTVTVKAIGVGGDYFLFHPLQLRSGSYLTADDYMADRVVLDEELAWALFGSNDVAGMSVTINNRPYPVAGVIHREDDFASKKAYQDGAGLFMSYDALNAISETKISCYELVAPDMITGYAKSVVSDKFPIGNGEVVQNTGRYSLTSLLKVIGSFGERSMSTKGILYPYWENAARMTEDYAALWLVLLVLCSLCPATCLVLLVIHYVKKLAAAVGEKVPEIIEEKVEAEKEKHYVRTGI